MSLMLTRLLAKLRPQSNGEKKPGLALLGIALLVGLIAQVILQLSTNDATSYWDLSKWGPTLGLNTSPLLGLLLYALAGFLLLRSLAQLKTEPATTFSLSTEPPPAVSPRFGFWLTSLGLALFAGAYTAVPARAQAQGYAPLLTWLLALGLFSFSVLYNYRWRWPDVKSWLAAHRSEALAVVILLLGAFLVRFINLELVPYAFVNDEGEMGKAGLCLLRGVCKNLFESNWAAQAAMAFVPTSLSIRIFGNTPLAVRLVSVSVGTLAVLCAYLFTRETFGTRTAQVAAFIAATFPYHIHFSRLAVDNIYDSLTSALVLWLVVRAAKRNSPVAYLGAGIAAGLCLYTYPGSRLSLLLAGGALAWFILTTRGFLRAQARGLVIFALALTITVLPVATYFSGHPEQFFARFTAEGLFSNQGMQVEINQTGTTVIAILTRQFLKSSLAFIATGGPGNFFNTPAGYFSTFAALFLVLGLFILAARLSKPQYVILFAWFWSAILLGSTLTSGAPSHQRMLGSSMAAAIVAAVGLTTSLGGLQMYTQRAAQILLIGILLFNGYQDLNFYFGQYQQERYFEDLSNEITYESRFYTRPLTGQGRFYLIGAPMTFTIFANFYYFAPDLEQADFNEVTREALAALPKDQDAIFLAVPYREPDLRQLAEWLPGGQWSTEYRRYRPEQPLFFTYKVSAAQLQAFQP